MNKVFMTALGAICTVGLAMAGTIALSEGGSFGLPKAPAREAGESVNPYAPTGNETVTGNLQILYHPTKDKVNKLEGAAQLGEGADGWSIQCANESKNLEQSTSLKIDGKAYATIKLSNGAQNIVTLPEGYVANAVTIYSVLNANPSTKISYFKEVDGETFDAPDHSYLTSAKDFDNPDVSYFPLKGNNSFTFTSTGDQALVVLMVDYSVPGEETPDDPEPDPEPTNPYAPTGDEETIGALQLLYHPTKDKINPLTGVAQLGEGAEGWTLAYTTVDKTFDQGSSLTVNGKKYASIKVSNGAQCSVTLPEGYTANAVTFYTSVNKDTATDRPCYFKEVDGVTFEEPEHDYLTSFKDYANPDVSYFPLKGNNSFTFQNSGEQLLMVIVVDYSVDQAGPGTSFGEGELVAPLKIWPSNNAKMIPVNGEIKLIYPEGIILQTEGKATIGDKECDLTVAENVVTIAYEGLTAGADVTLTIPAATIGNDEAANTAITATYTTAPENLLFYSDFNNFPYAYFEACPAGKNTDILGKSSTDKTAELGGMTFYSGTKGRVVALGDNVCSTDINADYGPYTEADAGATGRAVQLMDGGNGLYFETPEVEGPCDITLYLGNAGAAEGTMLLTDERGLKDAPLAELKFEKAKRIFKYTVNYPYSGAVKFRLYNQKIKVDINDFIVVKGEGEGTPRPEITDTDAPVLTSLWPSEAPYAPLAGTVTATFDEPVTVNGKATLGDKELDITVDGNTVKVAYEGLEAATAYAMTIPAVSDEAGNATEPLTVNFTTAAEDVLFYTDFNKFPYSFYTKYCTIPNDAAENEDIIAKNSTDVTAVAGDITYYSGTSGRVVAMGKSNVFEADEENAGASQRCIQVSGGGGDLYAELPELQGPCTVTLFIGNSAAKDFNFALKDSEGNELASFALPAAKNMYKYTYTYTNEAPVKLRIYNNDNQFNINDILVEKAEVAGSPFGDGELVAPLTVWPSKNAKFIPLSGEIKLTYPEGIILETIGSATLGDKECAMTVEGSVVTIAYEGLTPASDVTLTIPAATIGNDAAANTEITVDYTTAPENLLFYSDFNNFPYAYFEACPAGVNTDIIAKGSTDKTAELGGMTFYSGTKGRVVALGDNVCSPDIDADYGPYTEADAGATGRAVQLIDGGNGLYFETPEMEGPCDITLYLGNAGAAEGTMLLTDERGLKDYALAELKFEAAKRIFKYTVNYPYSGPVKFRLYNQKIKVDINDFIVVKGEGEGTPRPEITDTDAPVVTSLWPSAQPYAPVAGTVTVMFDEPVTVSGKAALDGKELDITVDGNTVKVAYEGLEAGKAYTMTIPAVADEAGNATAPIEVAINTEADDVLFYTDFNKFPYSFYTKYFGIPNEGGDNEDIIAKNSTDVTAVAGDITYFSGTNGRVVAMGKPNIFESDINCLASERCIQVSGGGGDLYAELPELQGPCAVELWIGNSTAAAINFSLKDAEGNELTTFEVPAEKKMYKYDYTYEKESPVKIRLYNNGNQFNINDILVKAAEVSSLDLIGADDADAVYYNLQGVRVENPANGIYIRVCGKDVRKVVVR